MTVLSEKAISEKAICFDLARYPNSVFCFQDTEGDIHWEEYDQHGELINED